MKQFAVIGLGRFGAEVCRALARKGHEVLGIDKDSHIVELIAGDITHAVTLDATDVEALKNVGIRNFDCAVVSVGEELEASVLITLNLKELGVEKVVAKANDDVHARILRKVGADVVVFPEKEMAARLAENLVCSHVLDCIDLGPEFALLELTPGEDMRGKSLGQLGFRQRFGVNVVAVRSDGQLDVSPQADRIIRDGDILVVVGSKNQMKNLEKHI